MSSSAYLSDDFFFLDRVLSESVVPYNSYSHQVIIRSSLNPAKKDGKRYEEKRLLMFVYFILATFKLPQNRQVIIWKHKKLNACPHRCFAAGSKHPT